MSSLGVFPPSLTVERVIVSELTMSICPSQSSGIPIVASTAERERDKVSVVVSLKFKPAP